MAPAESLALPSEELCCAELDGLVLGQGSWARAYRQATCTRRAALRLLFGHRIVTELELADDLTVISDEHIEECVVIAGEMIERWGYEAWLKDRQEAKEYFESRLAEIYLERAFPHDIEEDYPSKRDSTQIDRLADVGIYSGAQLQLDHLDPLVGLATAAYDAASTAVKWLQEDSTIDPRTDSDPYLDAASMAITWFHEDSRMDPWTDSDVYFVTTSALLR